jgi:hypothetical protein
LAALRRGSGSAPKLGSRRLGILIASLGVALGAISPSAAAGGRYTPPPCPAPHFHSAPRLDAMGVCMNAGVRTHHTPRGTYLFLTPDVSPTVFNGAGAGIYTDDGTLVWWHPRANSLSEDHDLQVVQFAGHRYLALYSGTTRKVGANNDVIINDGTVLLYNHHYRQVGQITAGKPFYPDQIDMHDFRITPQGDALFGVFDPVRRVVGGRRYVVVQYVVQEVSLVKGPRGIHTGKVLFQWKSLAHVPVSQTHQQAPPESGGGWDYFHGNSIAQDTDGNLIVSARNTWGIYKINVKTGRVMWQVGAHGGSRLPEPWCWQHDVTPLGHDEYSVFDDGTLCHPARGLIIRVSPQRHPAGVTLVRAVTHHPSIYSKFLGSTQQLTGGDALVDWGDVPAITEFGPYGRVRMDLSMTNGSYRGFRFSWTGWPTTPPAIAAQLDGGKTKVWASWNGATEVTAWRALVGARAHHLHQVRGPVAKSGFETAFTLGRRYAFVAVEALGFRGKVLRMSKTVATAS